MLLWRRVSVQPIQENCRTSNYNNLFHPACFDCSTCTGQKQSCYERRSTVHR
ncbi:LIM domain-containing protein [candidate division CSSED10-310 bacterium]|uniref:LIM domain-containing protein n=1 Tax=candidate division CSSED10-310 bacterium TaxID=2855610 RepID=A0ABV6YTM2_UNCC1